MSGKIKALPGTLWAAWKGFRRIFPVWPRRWKVARNLMLSVLLLAAALPAMGWPVLGKEAAFRRLEAQALLSPSELMLQEGNAFVTRGKDWITVGTVNHYGESWKPFQHDHPEIFHVIPRDELSVFLMPETAADGALQAVAVGLPEGAEKGVLKLDLAYETVEATRNEQGWMIFRIEAHPLRFYDLQDNIEPNGFTLELLDAGGNTVLHKKGELPVYLTFLSGQFTER